METYARKLYLTHLLREPAIRSAILGLELPSGSRGLDAGCGIGLGTLLLAESVGPEGHVTGLDIPTWRLAPKASKTMKTLDDWSFVDKEAFLPGGPAQQPGMGQPGFGGVEEEPPLPAQVKRELFNPLR